MKKIIIWLLTVLLICGSSVSCTKRPLSSSTQDSSVQTIATSKETPSENPTTFIADEDWVDIDEDLVDPASLTDEDATPIVIYSWNNEFKDLLDTYYIPDNAGFSYEYIVTEPSQYAAKLDSVLASADGAPDLFLLDADLLKTYATADNSLSISELGISYTELDKQFGYTYNLAIDGNGRISALSWMADPGGVFYNRALAHTYLGSDDPAVVQKSFSTWDGFMAMAQKINADSNGTVKAISGYDDIWSSFSYSREKGWDDNGLLYMDPMMDVFLDDAKQLTDEGLTWDTTQWDDAWYANMDNQSVLSYWGPLSLAENELSGSSLSDDAEGTAPTWGFCAAPVSFFQDGSWIAASKYDNNKATSADILRFFTMDDVSMVKLAQDGIFVNNVAVMTTIAEDPDFGVAALEGQNPFGILVEQAMRVDPSVISPHEKNFEQVFLQIVKAYANGDIASVTDAKAEFFGVPSSD